jgi:inorganic pyrophosphatase
MNPEDRELASLVEVLFQAHPWHGIGAGADAPESVTCFIEIVPTDAVKYELDKASGHLRIDRPQRYSSICPTLYGFVPQTYCGERVAKRCEERVGRSGIQGDHDPLDICVLTDRPVTHGNMLLTARPIGGLRMIDRDEADDKIIAVLEGDLAYGDVEDLSQCPKAVIDRLEHYFLSYKQLPTEPGRKVEIPERYGRDEAREVIRLCMEDYRASYGRPELRLPALRRLLGREG